MRGQSWNAAAFLIACHAVDAAASGARAAARAR
jgi:hypothetical protein